MTAAPERDLGTRFTRGAVWTVGARVLARSSGFVTTLVLARLLSPEAFGIVGLALLANGLIEALGQLGFREYLIYRRGPVRPLLGTAWGFIILRSALISATLMLAAPWIAAAFAMPEATRVLGAMALIPLIRGFANVESIYFLKRLEFHKQFVLDAVPQIGTLLVGVTLALLWRNVWALALAHVAGALLQTAASFLVCESTPRPRLSWRRGRLMFSFGLFTFLAAVTGYLAFRSGAWLAAWLFDSHALGLYVLAFTISQLPMTDLIKPLGKVVFPTLVLIRDDPARLANAFCRTYSVVAAITAPLCLGLVLVAHDFAGVILGPQWTGIAPLLQLFGAAALAQSLSTAGLSVPYALGRPALELMVGVIGLGALALALGGYLGLLPPGVRTLVLLVVCVAGAQVVQLAVRLWFGMRLVRVDLRRLAVVLLPTVSALAAMTGGALTVQAAFDDPLARLAAMIAVGAVAYLACLYGFWSLARRGPLADLFDMLVTRRGASRLV